MPSSVTHYMKGLRSPKTLAVLAVAVVLAAVLLLVNWREVSETWSHQAEAKESTPTTSQQIVPVQLSPYLGKPLSETLEYIGTPGVENSLPTGLTIGRVAFPESTVNINPPDDSDLVVTGYCIEPGLQSMTLSVAAKDTNPDIDLAAMQARYCPDGSMSGFARSPAMSQNSR